MHTSIDTVHLGGVNNHTRILFECLVIFKVCLVGEMVYHKNSPFSKLILQVKIKREMDMAATPSSNVNAKFYKTTIDLRSIKQ